MVCNAKTMKYIDNVPTSWSFVKSHIPKTYAVCDARDRKCANHFTLQCSSFSKVFGTGVSRILKRAKPLYFTVFQHACLPVHPQLNLVRVRVSRIASFGTLARNRPDKPRTKPRTKPGQSPSQPPDQKGKPRRSMELKEPS